MTLKVARFGLVSCRAACPPATRGHGETYDPDLEP